MKPEWGKKICCSECSNIFYDMRKLDAVCPKCGTKFKANVQKKPGKATKKHKKFAILENEEFDISDDYGTSDVSGSIEDDNLVMESE